MSEAYHAKRCSEPSNKYWFVYHLFIILYYVVRPPPSRGHFRSVNAPTCALKHDYCSIWNDFVAPQAWSSRLFLRSNRAGRSSGAENAPRTHSHRFWTIVELFRKAFKFVGDGFSACLFNGFQRTFAKNKQPIRFMRWVVIVQICQSVYTAETQQPQPNPLI